MINSHFTKLVYLAFWAFWKRIEMCMICHDNINDGKRLRLECMIDDCATVACWTQV